MCSGVMLFVVVELGVEEEGSEGVGVLSRAGASVGGKTDEAEEEGRSVEGRAAAEVLDSAKGQGKQA